MLLKNPGFMLAALALNRVMGSLLYEVKPSDPIWVFPDCCWPPPC
jgi:hypothetical protein